MSKNLGNQRFQVFIRLDNGNGCPLFVEKKQTIDQLISVFNTLDFELPQVYRILFRGRHINDFAKTIQDLGITESSILHIEQASQKKGRVVRMDVCIFWNGEKYIVKSESGEKILNLKQSVHKLLRIPPRDQLLVFKGFILQNNHTLEHYRIRPDSLICLHTSKVVEIPDDHSDYDQIIDGITMKDAELLESVLSVGEKKSGVSKSTLFRSDSMGKKNVEELPPYEIEIHHKGCNDDNLSGDERQFHFDLFKSFGMANPMTLSIGYNLFDSLKNPIDRFAFKTYEIKSEDEDQDDNEDDQDFEGKQQMKCDSLVNSITSFEI